MSINKNPSFNSAALSQSAGLGKAVAGSLAAPGLPQVYAELLAATKRIAELEARVQQLRRLEDALQVSPSGEVVLHATGELRLIGGLHVEVNGGARGVTLKSGGGAKLEVTSTGLSASGAKGTFSFSQISFSAGSVDVSTGMAKFSGVVKTDTIIANTVVGSSYTPGAGNLW